MTKKNTSNKTSNEQFIQRLKFIRSDLLSLKQESMAQLLGISHSMYSKMEAGQLAPSEKILAKMSRILAISLQWLRNGVGKPPHEIAINSAKKRRQLLNNSEDAISDEDLEKIISMAFDPTLKDLAANIIKTTGGTQESALADIILEKLLSENP